MRAKLLKLIVMIFSITLFVGCAEGNNKSSRQEIEVKECSDNVVITESPGKSYPKGQGLALGRVENCNGKDKAEKNLLSQIATYNSAILHGDKNNAMRYLYPDALVYCRKYYPGFSDEAITDEFFKSLSSSFSSQLDNLAKNGIEFTLVVSKFIRRVECGNDLFMVFNISSNICSESLYTHLEDDEQCIGISQNGGKNWTFLAVNDDTPSILRIKYSEEIINSVMGY